MKKKSSTTKSTISAQTVVLAALAWSVIALLFFLLFSISPSAGERPVWYSVATYAFEQVAFICAGILCFRNWQSSSIVSGRGVWLAIGLGMISFFIGNLFLAYWEVGLGNSPEVSPGDFFYILTYIFLGWGMLQAVLSKQLNLTSLQWLILAAIAIVGIVIAIVFGSVPEEEVVLEAEPPVVEQVSPSPLASPSIAATPTESPATPVPEVSPTLAPTEVNPQTPAWATALEQQLSPIAGIVSWLYIIGDVILVVMATTLLLAFWGGRFSLSWRFIAAAALSYYIADIWFNYAVSYIPDYQTGALPEVFWVFSGCLFAIGAALEYDLSTRKRTTRRRS
ncbi:MAG: hypothetical protein Kow00121_37500 [Elainellaceae cyanobacterium]